MTVDIFTEFRSEDITDAMLDDAARLFSEQYGIWGVHPPNRKSGKPGTRIRMSASQLRSQCLPEGARCSYVSATVDGTLAGHAFACRWDYKNMQVCWVTQLVVHRDHRQRRLATRIIEKVRKTEDEIFGIISAHPAACMAMSKACADTSFPHFRHPSAPEQVAIMTASPIAHIREAELRGKLFVPADVHTGLHSGVDSNFFVDHEEPFAALAWLEWERLWPLGALPDGHEYLLVFTCRSSRLERAKFLLEPRLKMPSFT
ncbi:uncharacterized protein B0H64DRAFT_386252 [Chaetomium fimeti]|uniref:N-acetyltransferase domain-containing protein n=1 Tax=Chaetomium fimeti TaxID=1854472 RepID=A0AAE0HND8_9PEZI|nr:hypothetical protein B0H64DRAFT_386252 [Chaetomium fimeti]